MQMKKRAMEVVLSSWSVQLSDNYGKDAEGNFIYKGTHGPVMVSFQVDAPDVVMLTENAAICRSGVVFIDYRHEDGWLREFGFVLKPKHIFAIREGQPYFMINGQRVNYFDWKGEFMPKDQVQMLQPLTDDIFFD
jgi:hypothetical protein